MNNNMPTPAPLPQQTPIQEPIYSQNQVQLEQQAMPMSGKNKNKKTIILILVLILLVVAILGAYFVLFKDDPEPKPEPNTNTNTATNSNTNTNGREEWNASKSIIKELNDVDAVKLVCTERTTGLVTDVSQVTVIFLYDTMRQIIVEESVELDDDTIEYYDYYLSSLTDVYEEMKNDNDNVILEIRKKKSAVSLAFSIDLSADIENPRNIFEYYVVNESMDYDQTREALEIAGYRCQ